MTRIIDNATLGRIRTISVVAPSLRHEICVQRTDIAKQVELLLVHAAIQHLRNRTI